MLKVILLLTLCVCFINSEKLKCDLKVVKDLQTGNTVDKTDFCKDKSCVFQRCREQNTMLVQIANVTKCLSTDWVAKNTSIIPNVPVFKSDYSKSEKKLSYVILYNSTMQNIMTAKKCWDSKINVIPSGEYAFLEDGSLRITSSGKNIVLKSLEFFVDLRIRQSDGRWVGPEAYISLLTKEVENTQDVYQAIGMLISCVFLTLVLVVYSMFEQLRGHYGKMLMAYVACFTVTFALMAAMRLGLNAEVINGTFCKYISIMMYFSILTTFFWLNVMSYEIWNTFRPKNKFRSPQSREHNRRFLKAALYAFGVPLLILVAVVIIDEQGQGMTPKFESCMHSKNVHLYHYVPMTILLFVNAIFFIMTSYHLWQLEKNKTLNSSESRITRHNQNIYGLYLKLSMSTGLNWIIDIIGVYVNLPTYISYIFDTYILLLGVIMFFVCVCNRNVLKLLSKRFAINRRFVNQSTLSTTATQDSKKGRSIKKMETSELNS